MRLLLITTLLLLSSCATFAAELKAEADAIKNPRTPKTCMDRCRELYDLCGAEQLRDARVGIQRPNSRCIDDYTVCRDSCR